MPDGRWWAYGFVIVSNAVTKPESQNADAAPCMRAQASTTMVWRCARHEFWTTMAPSARPEFLASVRSQRFRDPSTELLDRLSVKVWWGHTSIESGTPACTVGSYVRFMPEQGAAVITPKPVIGRVYEAARRIRLGDVDPTGRCRLDAAVRHLQDVARDDSADSGLAAPMSWVVRRVMLEVHQAPVFQEWIRLATWCSGHGGRWAERRTEIRGDDGAHIEATTVWIFIDGVTGAPAPLHADFFAIYGASAAQRRVSARHVLRGDPPDDAESEPWALRFTDLDLLGHVNNAAQWSPLEEAAARVGAPTERIRAELEHGVGVEPGPVTFHWRGVDGGVDSWLCTEAGLGSAGRIRPL